MDRWNIVAQLNYLAHDAEVEIVLAKCPEYQGEEGLKTISRMVGLADLSRAGFMAGDISTVMSPRTVITWAENARIFGDIGFAFRLTFLNKCDEVGAPDRRRILPALLRRRTAGEHRQRHADLSRNAMAPASRERVEVFQRAVAATCRAMAHRPALNVTFRAGEAKREAPPADNECQSCAARAAAGNGRPGRCPAPGRGRRCGTQAAPPRRQVAPTLDPQGEIAGAVFEALEQVRVRGARRQPDDRRRRKSRQRSCRARPAPGGVGR